MTGNPKDVDTSDAPASGAQQHIVMANTAKVIKNLI
jgi:hypothetical protein